MLIFGPSVTIDGSLYAPELGYASMDLVYALAHGNNIYWTCAFWGYFIFFSKMLSIFQNMLIFGLSVTIDGSLYAPQLGYALMDLVFEWHMEITLIGRVPCDVYFEIY